MWPTVLLSLLIACGNKAAPQPETPPEPAAEEEGDAAADAEEGTEGEEEGDAGSEADAEKPTPESLYAECKERVEGKQTEGECESDDDCATAGCGNEVCLPKSEVANVMTTCEDKLCFKILDTCGCHEGMCTWTLKDEVPEMANAPKLPPNRLPPTPPPTDGEQPEDDGGEAPEEEGAE